MDIIQESPEQNIDLLDSTLEIIEVTECIPASLQSDQ